MTDDEELRDDFGDELTALLHERAREPEAVDSAGARHRARTRRVRRWSVTATVAAAIVVALVAVTATGGGGKSLRVEEGPSTTVTPGHKVVSYRGVHVEVPASWPVVDGMHTQFCGGPFTDAPTAYLGPNDNGPPGCSPSRHLPRRDGVWLFRSTTPYRSAHTKTTASGEQVLAAPRHPRDVVRSVWFHDVQIVIGVGDDPTVGRQILDSLGYTEGASDTPRSGICARSSVPDAMPAPERLVSRLVLENGNVTLDPPAPSDHATVGAADVWRSPNPRADFEQYRVILARYTSKFPAEPNGNGEYVPVNRDILAWIIYATPITHIVGCGGYSIDAFDAATGTELGTISYGPGP